MYNNSDYLVHHGILGQKWGIRRYQNPDGTLTEAGKKKYAKFFKKEDKRNAKFEKKWSKKDHGEEYSKAKDEHDRNNVWKRERRDYTLDESGANKAAKFIALGPIGTYAYNNTRVAGLKRSSAVAVSLGTTIIGSATKLALPAYIGSAHIAKNEKKKSYTSDYIKKSNEEAERKRKQIAANS